MTAASSTKRRIERMLAARLGNEVCCEGLCDLLEFEFPLSYGENEVELFILRHRKIRAVEIQECHREYPRHSLVAIDTARDCVR